uniref:PiggyBac transposable element-derived protein domain-containing protein n=1 Tax=Astyanax mexicanus TaxID=7994 RepID=W5LUR1_ASTMX
MEVRGRPGCGAGGAAAGGESESEQSEPESEDSDSSYDSIDEDALIEGIDPDTNEEWKPSPEQQGTLPGLSPLPVKKRRITELSPASTSSHLLSESSSPTSGSSSVEDDKGETWHDISEDDEQPDIPKFYPKRCPGSQLAPNAAYSPLELFQIFMSESVVGTIVANTNAFARKRAQAVKQFDWFPLTVQEFYTYIGIVIFASLMQLKTLNDYWSEKAIYSLPFPRSVISKKRFLAITWNLHLCDPEKVEENKSRKGGAGYDRLFKIKPLYTSLLLACQTCFQPKRELRVVKKIVSSSSCIGPKSTKHGYGYKLFILVDSATGYSWNFFVYNGSSFKKTGKGLGYDLVTELVRNSLLGTGYKLYLDQFYTSPALLSDLYAKEMLACGMIPTNRLGFPRAKLNDIPANAARGTIRWTRRGELLFVKWKDTREVAICTNFHKAYNEDTINKRVKDNQGVLQKRHVPIPCAFKDYNTVMDREVHSDALLRYNNALHQTKRWYMTFFYHFIDTAVENSFILHKELAKQNGKDALTSKHFREALVTDLTKVCTRSAPLSQRSVENECYPSFFTEDPSAGRRVCALCKLNNKTMKTPAYCMKCQVPLCLMPKRNCFLQWHQEDAELSDLK